MRILVYEYTSATGLAQNSLGTEGWAMLSALSEDLGRLPGVEVMVMLEENSQSKLEGVKVRRVRAGEEIDCLGALASKCDYCLLIAPECGGILEQRCRVVQEAKGRLLGPNVEAVQRTGDKLALAEYLRQARVPTPPCTLLSSGPNQAPTAIPVSGSPGTGCFSYPAVCKPRVGAGSQATFQVSNAEDLEAALVQAVAEGWHGVMILQPLVRGQAVSVAFLLGPQQCLPLLPASQHLSEDGRFRYRGGRLPLATDLAKRAVSLGRRAVAAVTGLKGYVGVDLVVGSEMDGSGDRVIEINPRLTTSYVGLRALARGNLAEAMLQLALGKTVSPPEWNPGEIVFDSCGNSNLHWAGCSEFDERKDSVNAENIATGNRRRTRNPGPRAPGHGPVGR